MVNDTQELADLLCVYGIAPRRVQLPEIAGLDVARSIQTLVEGELQAFYSPVRPTLFPKIESGEIDPITGRALAMLAVSFDQIVNSLFQFGTLLPLRFGTLLPDVEMLRQLLRDHQTDWCAAVTQLDGCVEISVKVHADRDLLREQLQPAGDANPVNGTAYLLQRKREIQQTALINNHIDTVVGAMHAECAALSKDSLTRAGSPSDDPPPVLNAHYLVESANLTALFDILERYGDAHDWLYLTRDEPTAPYHFVG